MAKIVQQALTKDKIEVVSNLSRNSGKFFDKALRDYRCGFIYLADENYVNGDSYIFPNNFTTEYTSDDVTSYANSLRNLLDDLFVGCDNTNEMDQKPMEQLSFIHIIIYIKRYVFQ